MTEPLNEYRGEKHSKPFDGVRGFAFIIILLFHLNGFLGESVFILEGQTGVWLFFVLSGFLLARSKMVDIARSGGVLGWPEYAIRRIFRIYPLFLVYIFLLWYFMPVEPERCLRVLALESTFAIDWTLYIEFRFYLVLPLFLLPLCLGLRKELYLVFLCVAAISVGMFLFPFFKDYREWYFSGFPLAGWRGNLVFISYLGCFLPGLVAAYLAIHFPLSKQCVGIAADFLGLAVLSSVVITRWMLQPGMPCGDVDYGVIVHLWFPYSVLFAFWIYLLSAEQGLLAKVLSSRYFRFLGDISYPGYLIHVYVFHSLRPIFGTNWMYGMIALVVVIIMAYILHILIELPMYRLGCAIGIRCSFSRKRDHLGASKEDA